MSAIDDDHLAAALAREAGALLLSIRDLGGGSACVTARRLATALQEPDPYLPDLWVCRPELADTVLGAPAR